MPELVRDLGMMYPKKTSKRKRHYGIYKCPYCSNFFKTQAGNIKRGSTQSCGCYQKTQVIKIHTTHGLTRHPLYNVWKNMMQRTQNPENKAYKYYGARGIKVCDRWRNNFKSFYDWAINNGYEKGLTIDRINNNGNYEPSNCRWATITVQHRNTRKLMSTNTSGFRGVSWRTNSKKWRARIKADNKEIHIGYFNSAKKAAQAYDGYVIEHNLEHIINF